MDCAQPLNAAKLKQEKRMPWNEPGKGNKDPWKNGGNQQPPDLDEVFKNINRKISSLFGGGGGGSSRRGGSDSGVTSLLTLALIGLLVWGVYDSVHVINQQDRGVVLRFGEYKRILQPGLNWTWPRPIERVMRENVTQLRSMENRAQMLTADENLMDLNFEVQYRINDVEFFVFNVRDPDETLQQSAESAMREVIGANQMDFILEAGRGAVALESKDLLQQILDRYATGLEVTTFNLQDVKPPRQVKDAFDDAVKAREDEERYVNEAEAYSNSVIPEARGRAARVIQEAEAYKAAKVALAEGEAERFSLLRVEYEKAPEVTRQRLYLQTMEEIMGRSSKVLLDVDQGNQLLYLPLDRMSGGGESRGGQPVVPPVGLSDSGISSSNSRDDRARNAERRSRGGR